MTTFADLLNPVSIEQFEPNIWAVVQRISHREMSPGDLEAYIAHVTARRLLNRISQKEAEAGIRAATMKASGLP